MKATKQRIQNDIKQVKQRVDKHLEDTYGDINPSMKISRDEVADVINLFQVYDMGHFKAIKTFTMLDKDCVAVQGREIAYAMKMRFKGCRKMITFADKIKV